MLFRSSMAVKLWRHTLMHTGEPRELRDPKTGRSLCWLLHWREQLPEDQHFTLTGTKSMQLNMALFHLLRDLKKGQRKYLADLGGNNELQVKFRRAEKQLSSGQLEVY